MAICKFYASGNCRYGSSCNFEHIGAQQNRWGTNNTTNVAASKYNETSLKSDLTEARPQWKLSVYGPAKEEPNLIVGTDRSCEEDRYLYYTSMRTTNNTSQYMASYEQLFNQMEAQTNAIVNNPTAAIQHYEKEKTTRASPFSGTGPASNSLAPFTGSTGGAFGTTGGAFGKPSAFGSTGGGGGAFGQSSAFGQTATSSAFGGNSSFGSTNTLGSGSAFGSTSTLGNNNSAFGSTSALGSGSAFGSAGALNSGSAFGSANTLGSGSAFGSTSALGGNSAFGKPSAFGQTASQASAFGSNTTTGSAFGSTNTLGS
ncbi:Nucleoporin-like protein amo1, partial [Choanephora cucurbitarum]